MTYQPITAEQFAAAKARDMRPTFDRVVADVCAKTSLLPPQITGYDRDPEATHARQLVMWKCRLEGLTLPEIARFINRDEATVRHGVAATERRLEPVPDPIFKTTRRDH